MALSSNTYFVFRSTATAGNTNGGGFVDGASGTDYSNQDSAQYSGTDGASSNAKDANPTFTSATNSFGSDCVGNLINISSGSAGTEIGFYEIISVDGAGGAVLDRPLKLSGSGSLSSIVYKVGGALSFGVTGSAYNSDGTILALGVNYYVKSGSYTVTNSAGSILFSTTPTPEAPSFFIGFTTTPGDTCTGSNRPELTIDVSTSFTINDYYIVKNLSFISTVQNGVSLSGAVVNNCKFKNISTTADRRGATTNTTSNIIFDSEFISYRGVGLILGVGGPVHRCHCHSSKIGIHVLTGRSSIVDCVIEGCTDTAILCDSNSVGDLSYIYRNTLYGGNSQKCTNGITLDGTNRVVSNNIITGFTTGVNKTISGSLLASLGGIDEYNCYYNNTSNVTNWALGSTSVTSDPEFTDVVQITGSNGTTSGSVLTSSGADFSTVVDGQDYVWIVSGTGVTTGIYGITSHTTTTLTLDIAPGDDATADKVFAIVTGKDFSIGFNLVEQGAPGSLTGLGLNTTGYTDIGPIQKKIAAYSRGRVVNK